MWRGRRSGWNLSHRRTYVDRMTPLPDRLSARARVERGARPVMSPGIAALGLSSLAALVLVAMLALQAMRASQEQARMADRSLRDYAAFGAATFFSRSAYMIVNSTGYFLGVVDASLSRTGQPNTALSAALAVSDSAFICDCGPKLRMLEARIIDQRTGATLATRRRTRVSPIDATPVDPLRILPAATPAMRWRLYGTEANGSLIAMRRLEATVSGAPVIVVLAFDGRSVTEEIFADVYASFPNLLPTALLNAPRNDSIIAIDVRSTDDKAFAHFGPATARHQQSLQNYGGQNTAAVIGNLTSSAEQTLRATMLGAPRGTMVVLLTTMTLLAVFSTMWFAWRSHRLGRLRMDFASSVSHELRTPLTEIMLYAELIESGRTRRNDSTESAARTIRGEARRLHQLVENSLHMARTERRLVRLSPAPESLATIIDELLDVYAPIAARSGAQITHDGDTTVTASVDPDAIRHILLNVLDNALRYGPAGGRVHVVTERLGAMAAITVDDEGPGVPAAERARVFEPYVRLDRDVGQVTTGNGIGLAVVADLVREMHGTVRIDDAPIGGARVFIQFPVVEAPQPTHVVVHSAPSVAVGASTPESGSGP